MATDIATFNNPAFGTVRTIEKEGRVLFCGRDVAAALGYENPGKAVRDHARSKGGPFRYPLQTPGGIQEARFITEGDLYRLIASSKLPAAQAFESWVFDEVLPSIRRHGLYAIDELLQNDDFLEEAIHAIRTERAKRLAAEQALLEVSPKVSYYDLVLSSPDAVAVTLIAKDYGMGARKFNALLHDLGIQFKQSGVWVLYQNHAGQGYTDTKTHVVAEGRHTRLHTYWTQKGRLFIYGQLKEHGILPVIERADASGVK